MTYFFKETVFGIQKHTYWTGPTRILHWLSAITLVAAAGYTNQSDLLHSELGWAAFGLLLMLQAVYKYSHRTNWAIWFVTLFAAAVNFSGWLLPDSSSHSFATMSLVMLAAFYVATVVFESINQVSNRLAMHF